MVQIIRMFKKTNRPILSKKILACIYAFVVFYVSYTLTNLYADSRSQSTIIPSVANRFFGFNGILHLDSYIPFIDWMIIPYAFSLPLFVASFFMIKVIYSDTDPTVVLKPLRQLTHRLILATLLGCLFFYYYPLRFSFHVESQLVTSQWQWAYNVLHTFDKPYNRLPSLHVTYAMVLVLSLWFSLSSKFARLLLTVVGVFTAISTVFTWQHHLLDVFAGILLGWIVLVIDYYLEHKHSAYTKASIIKYLVIAVLGFLLIQIVLILCHVDAQILKFLGYYWLISFVCLAMLYHYHRPNFLKKIALNKVQNIRYPVFYYSHLFWVFISSCGG